jgi:hypothetical protein
MVQGTSWSGYFSGAASESPLFRYILLVQESSQDLTRTQKLKYPEESSSLECFCQSFDVVNGVLSWKGN